MNRFISWLQSNLARVLFTLSLVVVTFILSAAFGTGNQFQAQAEPVTPEATEYNIDRPNTSLGNEGGKFENKVKNLPNENVNKTIDKGAEAVGNKINQIARLNKEKVEGVVEEAKDKITPDSGTYSNPVTSEQAKEDVGGEEIKDKLNLDEPVYSGTKKFFKQLKGEDVEINEPKPSR